ncbi:hypothetical protein GOP47_0028955 [Adiantum capillus-veneris]|nr:hypothetical protein GOP47_0028955 [Adiantum capillus-veneris]
MGNPPGSMVSERPEERVQGIMVLGMALGRTILQVRRPVAARNLLQNGLTKGHSLPSQVAGRVPRHQRDCCWSPAAEWPDQAPFPAITGGWEGALTSEGIFKE